MCKKLFVRVFLLFELYANEFEARFFWPTRYLTKSSVVICTENLFSSLTSGINLVSIGRQMPPQGSLLSVRGQSSILFRKQGRCCHFGSDGSIYIFAFFTPFFV